MQKHKFSNFADQGFNPCHKNNGTDVCVPCPKDHFVEGNYSTGVFEYHPCAERPACQQGK